MRLNQLIILIISFFLGSISESSAQITISGFPTWYDGNSNYNYFNHTFSLTSTTPSVYNPIDNPSYQYKKGIGGLPGIGGNAENYIFKRNNYWYLVQSFVYSGGSGDVYYFRTQNQYSNVNPPCSANWLTVNYITGNPEVPSGNLGLPNGVGSYPITMTGTCYNATAGNPISTSSMTPTGVILPQFSTADIAAIQNPTPGQMVWNSTELCIQVFNGTSWNCVL